MAEAMNKEPLKAQKAVPLAFLFVLFLLTSTMIVSFNTISSMRQGMARILDEHSTEMDLLQSLHMLVQQRMTLVRELLLEDDIFKREEKYQRFDILGGRYNSMLTELAQIELKSQAQQHLLEMQQYIHSDSEYSQAVLDLVFGQRHLDKNYILAESSENHERFMYSFSAMQMLLKAEADKEWRLADQHYTNLFDLLWSVAIIILTSSIFIAYRTSRYVRQNNTALTNMAREKSMLLATMSHEIRTPLTSVIGFSETLLDTDTTKEERIAGINAIVRNSRHLQQVINDVLAYSKLDAKQVVLLESKTDLRTLFDDLCGLLKPRAEDKGIEFGIQAKGSVPETIYTDEIKLKQILVNLVGNAIKFTEQGKVELRIEFLDEKSMLLIEVIDSGIGMDSDELLHIFEPYKQVGEKSASMGTGLGLYISQQTVHMMGGSLEVESERGVGSHFSLSIPVGDVSNVARIQWTGDMVEMVKGALNRAIQLTGNVLLAEDREDNQHLFSMYMNKAGVNLNIVDNGKDAVAEALQGDYSLVLMDMQMPVMDGITAVKRLREMAYTKPVLALTANNTSDERQRCLDAGFDDFLTKPISRGNFLQAIMRYLQNRADDKPTDLSPLMSNITEEELRPALDYFVTHLPEQYARMNQAVSLRDWLALKQEVHDIKGSAGGVGYPLLTQLAMEIEFAIAKQDEQEVVYLLQLMDTQIECIQLGYKVELPQVENSSST